MKMMDQITGLENSGPSHFPHSYGSIILYCKNSYHIVVLSAKSMRETTNNEYNR